MFKNYEFVSERLRTSFLTELDAEALLHIYSDSEAMKFRRSRPLKQMKDAMDMIAKATRTDIHKSKVRLGIRNKLSDELLGTLLLTVYANAKHSCEIGFSFGKEHWARGYAQETLKMVEANIKSLIGIQELQAWCRKENVASVAVFRKAGFCEIEQAEFPESRLFRKRF